MAFSLIDHSGSAIPVALLTKSDLAAWLEGSGASVKVALVPDDQGRLGRVLVGLGEDDAAGRSVWALAGLPEALPEGSYRLDRLPTGADPTRLALGWALGTYRFTRYHAKPPIAASLVWPAGADRNRVE